MKIALISDTHLADRAVEFAANFVAAVDWIDRNGFDLVIHLGDITADGAGQAAEFDEALRTLCGCRTQLRYLPGNHDVGDNPAAPGARSEETPLSPAGLADYRLRFGADWWSFAAGGWHLIGLDAQLFGSGTAEEREQFRWLQATLRAVAAPIALFLHKPLFRDGTEDAEDHVRYVPFRKRRQLLACFVGKDLRLVVSGHAHQQRLLTVGATQHVWLPSTAFTISDALQEPVGEKDVGLASLELTPNGHAVAFHKPDGMVDLDLLDHPHVYPRVAEIARRLREAAGP